MLDDARIRARRARRQPFALDQRDANPGLREEGGCRRADDAATDDDDVLRHPSRRCASGVMVRMMAYLTASATSADADEAMAPV